MPCSSYSVAVNEQVWENFLQAERVLDPNSRGFRLPSRINNSQYYPTNSHHALYPLPYAMMRSVSCVPDRLVW